jgi:(2Fe-2S) ferredoxin
MSKSLLVCVNHRKSANQPSCAGRGSEQIAKTLEDEIALKGLNIQLERIHCLGACEVGPNIKLVPKGAFFKQVSAQNINEVIGAIHQFCQDDTTCS